MLTAEVRVVRLDYGYFVRPGAETATGRPRAEPVLGYAVVHPRGVLLVDTGMGHHPEVDAHYHPRRIPLPVALHTAGIDLDDVNLVANCHLHFDHCGGNPSLAGRPILVQKAELAAAQAADYTLPDLIAAPGLTYDVIDGEAEPLPGVFILPTPGHTAGHQSLVVRRPDGTVVVLNGQGHDTASDYAADVLADQAAQDGNDQPLPIRPAWVSRLRNLDPARVYFAHDHAVWVPS